MVAAPTPVEIFCSYAHEDEAWLRKLETHLSLLKRQDLVSLWYDRLIVPGTDWAKTIDTHLETASVILLLVSADFFASDYCYGIEMKCALERQDAGEARVVPILVRSVDWKDAPFARLQALPAHAKPLTSWQDEDMALANVAAGIRQAIEDLTPLDVSAPHMSVRLPHPSSRQASSQQRDLIVRMLRQDYDKRLAQSLQGAAMMVLGLHERTDVIRSSAQLVFQRSQIERETPLPLGTSITHVYDDAGQGLLILGAPGAGKTTLLLDLARELLTRAEENSTHPIPVILNLSSWASKRSPLPPWISDQLRLVYGVPSRLGQTLLKQDHWLVLFDGLDEVEISARTACIEAINQYREEHFVPLVVCSRSQEYEKEQAQLALSGAVEIQPLQEQEVTEYLKHLGKSMEVVRTVLQTNPVLNQLLTNPLMLNVVILTYRDKAVKDLPKLGSVGEQQRQIFTRYVERMLEQRGAKSDFTAQQTCQWLTWLAQQMNHLHLTEFHVEQLQPTWLPTKQSQTLYRMLVRLVVFLLAGLVAGLFFGLHMYQLDGWVSSILLDRLLAGLFVGLSAAVLVERSAGLDKHLEIRTVEVLTWSWKNFWVSLTRCLISVSFFGLIIGLIVGPLQGWSIILFDRRLDGLLGWLGVGLFIGLSSGLILGLVLGLLYGLSYGQIDGHLHVKPAQGIRNSGWNALRIGLTAMLIGGLVSWLAGWLVGLQIIGLIVGLIVGLGGGLLYGGAVYLAHYILRFLLWRNGVMPWRYIRFLEETTMRILLQRVGGGYCFIHPLFQEYFASQGEVAVPRFQSQLSQEP